MSCLATDYISPKHSSKILMNNTVIMPVSSTCLYLSTSVTMGLSYTIAGHICTLVVPEIVFTGADEDRLTFDAALPTAVIPTPIMAVVRKPVPVMIDGVMNLAMSELATGGVTSIVTYADQDRAAVFTNGTPCSVCSCVLEYAIS